MKLSILHNTSRHYNPEDSIQIIDLRSVPTVDHHHLITAHLLYKSRGILLISDYLYACYDKYISGVIITQQDRGNRNTERTPVYMLVKESDLEDVAMESLINKWAGFVFDNTNGMIEHDFGQARSIIRSLVNTGRVVYVMGLQSPRQAFWLSQYYNNKLAGVFSSLPVAYGSCGLAFHPEINPTIEIPEEFQSNADSSAYYSNIIQWNVRCMDAWAQGVELKPPAFL